MGRHFGRVFRAVDASEILVLLCALPRVEMWSVLVLRPDVPPHRGRISTRLLSVVYEEIPETP